MSEAEKDESDQAKEEVGTVSTDIAATEVESQHIAQSSEPLPSTVDVEGSGVTETVPTIHTSEILASADTETQDQAEASGTAGTQESGEAAPTIEGSEPVPDEEAVRDNAPGNVESDVNAQEATAADAGAEESAQATAINVTVPTAGEDGALPPAEAEADVPPPAESKESAEIPAGETETGANIAAEEESGAQPVAEIVAPAAAAQESTLVPPAADATALAPDEQAPATSAENQQEAVSVAAEQEAPPESEEKKDLPVSEGDATNLDSAVPQTSTAEAEPLKVASQSLTEEVTTERSDIPGTAEIGSAQAPATSPTPQAVVADDKDATATVKFHLLPSKVVVTIASTISQSIQQLKGQLATEVQVPTNLLQFSYGDKSLSDTSTLKELNVQPNGTIQLDVTSINPAESPLRTTQPRPELGLSDVITVRLLKENNDYEDVVVEIDRSYRKKPFLGGFRHKLTGAEFHHASAQTMPKPIPPSTVNKNNRDTQTVFESTRRTQTTNTTSTQMTKVGCYVSIAEDKVIYPRKYFTSEEYFARRLKAIIVLQSYFRRWQARNIVNELKMDRDRRLAWEEQEELRKRREKEMRIKREFERRMNPKTKEDFDLVYAALEKWRLEELAQIDAELEGPERKAALCALLDQETQLIASIGRHKLVASHENKEKNTEKFLSKAAAPKRWKAYDGRYTEMDTQYTIRAREMMDIYNSINMKFLTQDERLDILLTLKHTVKEHDCKLTRDIIELIDREADLLMRGVGDTNLDGLRKRISTLFLQYCKNPLFNPEAARLLKVPQDPNDLRKDIYFCNSANQYLPSTEFKITSKSRKVGKSRKVQEMDNIARTRQDYSQYRVMLRDIRRAEESHGDDSKIAYLIQEKDLQYLIENVWCAQSILSAWDDLFDLVLVRWDKDEEWSPWNCILLTKDEAVSHSRLDHLYEAYGQVFIHKVRHKHTLARIYFSRIPGMSEQLRQKVSAPQKLQGPAEIKGTRALSMT